MSTVAADVGESQLAVRNGLAVRIVRFGISVLAAQSLLGAIVLLGYLYRRMRYQTLSIWLGDDPVAPAWFMDPAAERGLGRYLGGLGESLRIGLTALCSLAVLILPAGCMMALSWYAGWNNSFNKGYELAAVGPLLGLSGIFVGMLTLCYLPLAQARQALTGDWRTLFDWRLNLQLISARPATFLWIPVAYGLLAIISAIARGFPTFAPQVPAFTGVDSDPQGWLDAWFFWWGIPFVLGIYWLKGLAARGYARCLLKTLASGRLIPARLHQRELKLLEPAGQPVADNSSPDRLPKAWLLALPLWFPLFAVLYVQQFVNYLGAWGWLNHPLILLPLLSYSP